ncbi:MAG: SIMPL domain-containing protein [Verrucomicrobiota bacterium]
MSNPISKPHLFGMIAGLFLAAGLVFSAMLGTTAWVKIKNSQFITVKGSARKNIKSDLALWSGSFGVEAGTLLEAQRKLREDRARVDAFLNDAGMTNHSFTPIIIEEKRSVFETMVTNNGSWKITGSEERNVGYKLRQSVEVRTTDVDRIVQLDGESAALVEQGVLFTTDSPRYLYTKAGEAKIEMLGEATKDARTRAEQIATQGGRAIASLHDADMGIFQITPLNNSQTSGEGMNDTTSVEKTITAVVTTTFSLN